MLNFGDRYLSTISPDHFFCCCFFQNFNFFICYNFFFAFVNLQPYSRKKFNRHLLWKYTSDSLQKSYLLLGRFSTKVVQRIVKFEILDICQFFFFFFSFSLTWDHMGVKASNNISEERTHQVCSPICMDTPGGSLPKLLEEWEI